MEEEEKKESPPSTDDSPQQEPQLNVPSTDEPIVPAVETSAIINPPSEINDMEVHHHAHDPAAPHHKKNWKSYFWEFLMLFLAVFCGFFAEYQLEHKIERDREKQYMESMVEDLVADTAMLSSVIQFATRIKNGLDSLQNNFFDTDNVAANTLTIYRQNTTYTRLIVANFSDQTAIQLRNSGTMRLIRKRNIANAISRYWIGINSVEYVSGMVEKQLDEISEAGYNIFNRKNIIKQSRDSLTRLDNALIDPAARFMTNDKNIFINYANRINRLTSNIDRFLIPFLKSQKIRGDSLIRLVQKEYH
jgi:hypothetical protein